MTLPLTSPCTAFAGSRAIAGGPLGELALQVRARLDAEPGLPVLVLDDGTGAVVDLDLRGTAAEILARLAPPVPQAEPDGPKGRGRPRLGVVAREVTLLPRHWEWLGSQPGGASVTLRRLVEEAKRAGGARERRRLAQERAYRAMSSLGGDEPGYEEALRALYAGDRDRFEACILAWPGDVRRYVRTLAGAAFEAEG